MGWSDSVAFEARQLASYSLPKTSHQARVLSRAAKLVRGEAAGRVPPKLTLPLPPPLGPRLSGGAIWLYREELTVPVRLAPLKLVPLRLGREESEEQPHESDRRRHCCREWRASGQTRATAPQTPLSPA